MNMNYGNSLIGLVILVLVIIALVDIYKSSMTTGKKVLWALGVVLFPVIGLVLYYILEKKALGKI